LDEGQTALGAIVASPDGQQLVREALEGHDPQQLGKQTAQNLLARGGAAILEQVYGTLTALPQQP